MSEKKPTPGPWSLDRDGLSVHAAVDDYDGVVELFTAVDCYLPLHVCKANIRMAAAAPDLYEALKVLADDYKALADSGDAGNWRAEDQPKYQQALSALAKAKARR